MTLRDDKSSAEAAPKGRGGRTGSGRNGLGAGAPMTASFIGLLMLGSIRPAEAEDADQGTSLGTAGGEGGMPVQDGTPQLSGQMAVALAAVPQVAAGSILTVGDFIEPMAVAQLSGNFILAEQGPAEWTAPQNGAGDGSLNISNNVDADVSVALGTTAAAATEVATEADGEDSLEPPGQSFDGTSDNDTLTGTELADRMLGGDGDDAISGGAGDDVVFGGAGADDILGQAGDDELWGGAGGDLLDGGEGDDALFGDAGDDDLVGGAGNDRLDGGAGDDRLVGGSGSDRLVGGPGDDTLVVESITDIAIETQEGADGGGNDTLEVDAIYAENTRRDLAAFAPEGNVTFSIDDDLTKPLPDDANAFRQQIDPDIENITLLGDADHDVIGSDKDNVITGNDGNNQLHGGLGDDALWGGDGEDLLYGGEGDDILFGGEGDDLYLLGLAESGTDTVFDHQGSNLLRLDGADPSTLSARLDGSTLVLEQSGAEIVRIDDYTSSPESFQGVEIDGQITPIEEFLPKPPAMEPATAKSDLLGDYLGQPTDEPPSAAGELELPAEAAIDDTEADGFNAAMTIEQPKEQGDLLESFMIDQEIWTTGDEQSLYALGGQTSIDGTGAMDEGKDARS